MSNPNDLVKPSSRREVLLCEQAYAKGAEDQHTAMAYHYEYELWKARHPVRHWFHQVRLKAAMAWLRFRAPKETEDARG